MQAVLPLPPEEGIVTITTRMTPSGYLETVIADSGPGIAPEHRGKPGKPFFTTKLHGLGLGLSICHMIVRAHGGTLAVVNNQDKGATASFSLLLANDRPGVLKASAGRMSVSGDHLSS
jgi:signal transduction histidine kinase